MSITLFFTAALAALSAAAPTSTTTSSSSSSSSSSLPPSPSSSTTTTTPSTTTEGTYYGIALLLRADAPVAGGPAIWEPAPGEINQLMFLGNDTSISEIKFDHANNVDIDSVECRAYKDADGVVPGSAPFTNAEPAWLSTNLVQIQSILCYVTESS